jgi:hypothetical protein
MPELNWNMIFLGCIGGLFPDILRLIQNRYDLSLPGYFKSPMFWVSLVLLILLGGFSAWFLGANEAKEALAYGFGAPEIVSKAFGKITGGVDRGVDRGENGRLELMTWWGA